MSINNNKVQLIGSVNCDPVMYQHLDLLQAKIELTIKNPQKLKHPMIPAVQTLSITAYDKIAEISRDYVKPGLEIAILGSLVIDSTDNQIVIVASELMILTK